MVLWRVTLNDFIFTSVTLIIGRKSDTQWKVFTEHSTTLDLLPDSESHITHVRLLSGHLSNIVGWTDDGRPKNNIVIALPYMVNKREWLWHRDIWGTMLQQQPVQARLQHDAILAALLKEAKQEQLRAPRWNRTWWFRDLKLQYSYERVWGVEFYKF